MRDVESNPKKNLIGQPYKGRPDKKGFRYTMQSVMGSVAIKIYLEQVEGYSEDYMSSSGDSLYSYKTAPDGSLTGEKVLNPVVAAEIESNIYAQIKTTYTPSDAQVLLMKHDRDVRTDDIWLPAAEKPHYHILIRFLHGRRCKLGGVLSKLGVHFRAGLDDDLFRHHGVEAPCHFTEYVVYLMHETKKARAEGQTPYDITEFVSNLPAEDIQKIVDDYNAVADADQNKNALFWAQLDHTAYALGQGLNDYDDWYNSLSFDIRCNPKMKTVSESYFRGIRDRAEDPQKGQVTRLCVFIQGPPNCGKTYGAMYALQQLGVRYLKVEGGGTGRFDNLSASHDGIIISDDIVPNLLNLSDNYITQVYRRTKNNPYWCGHYFIVTSNLSFKEWLIQCGYDHNLGTFDYPQYEHHDALWSRFFICTIKKDGTLKLKSYSQRGSNDEQEERIRMFMAFADQYDQCAQKYRSMKHDLLDITTLLGERYQDLDDDHIKAVQLTLDSFTPPRGDLNI